MISGPFLLGGFQTEVVIRGIVVSQPNTLGPAEDISDSLINCFLPSMKFELFQTSTVVLSEPNGVNGVWDTSTGTKTKWTNVLELGSGMYHGCRFK